MANEFPPRAGMRDTWHSPLWASEQDLPDNDGSIRAYSGNQIHFVVVAQ
jgi:hypothetical protein